MRWSYTSNVIPFKMKHCVLKSTFIENIFIQCNDSFTIACCRPWFQFKTFQKCFRCQKDVNSTHSKIFQPEPDLKVVELWRLPAQEKTLFVTKRCHLFSLKDIILNSCEALSLLGAEMIWVSVGRSLDVRGWSITKRFCLRRNISLCEVLV